MYIHRSLGVASLVALMAAHREALEDLAGPDGKEPSVPPVSRRPVPYPDFTTRAERPMADLRRTVRRQSGEQQA